MPDNLPPRGTAREQLPPEQQPRPPEVRKPAEDDLKEGHLGNTPTAGGPTGRGAGAKPDSSDPMTQDERPEPQTDMER